MIYLQPTRITLFLLLWFIAIFTGGIVGSSVGLDCFGIPGGILGGLAGLFISYAVGARLHRLNQRRFFRKIQRRADDELWRIVHLGIWNFYQTAALLELAGRGHEVRDQLPRIIKMLESDDKETRIYGWDALRLVFNDETRTIGDYDPRSSTADCRAKVAAMMANMTQGENAGPDGHR